MRRPFRFDKTTISERAEAALRQANPVPSITCPRCGNISCNPNDIVEQYCGHCHWWTSSATLGHIQNQRRPDATH